MGEGFGEGVSTLLNTYAKCLSLLKTLTKASRSETSSLAASDVGSVVSLRRSIRSDRSRVHNAYRSRLYRDGKRMSQGDAPARSALRRIVNTLRAALRSVLRLARAPGPDEYGSLTALSNTSRIDAIKTMEDLSRRLNSTPSSISSTSKDSSSSGNSGSRTNNRHATKKSKKTTTRGSKSGNKSKGEPKARKQRVHRRPPSPGKDDDDGKGNHGHSDPHHRQHHPPPPPPHSSKPRKVTKTKKTTLPSPSTPSHTHTHTPLTPTAADDPSANHNHNHRISFLSTSTDSTKLGEIPYRPRRLLRRQQPTNEDVEEQEENYEIRPAYPLYTYHEREMNKKKKGGLLRRIFGGREETATATI